MSGPYENRGSSRRSVWTHWVPLVVTVTVATVGVAAWVWSQREDSNEEDSSPEEIHHLDYENADYGDNPPYGASSRAPKPPPSFTTDPRSGEAGYGTTHAAPEQGVAPSWGSKMAGALKRTPSPNQVLGTASRSVVAGVAAAGAAVGSALASIREGDKDAYADHETWSEEADAKKKPAAKQASSVVSMKDKDTASSKKRKVAIVVSADSDLGSLDEDAFHEHASILSHIPRGTDFSKIKLYILIYAPMLKDAAPESSGALPPPSMSSSYSNIEHDQAQSPKVDEKSPLISAMSSTPGLSAVYLQAVTLVEKERHVIPYSSPNSHLHILRQLQPEVVYLQESLAGDNGSGVTQLQTWLRHDIILVVGAESGAGGLADSESEAEKPAGKEVEKWWQREDRVGRGRGVVVVDSMRVHDDWSRRVQGKD